MEKKKVFRSRISVFFIGLMLASFIPIIIPIFQEKAYQDLYVPGGVLLFIILLSTGMRYVISGDKLFIKVWFITSGRLNITQIVSIERSYNPLSSPSVSLKRLCIGFANGRSWLISPVREEEFIEELKAVNPDISVNVTSKKGIWRIQDWDV